MGTAFAIRAFAPKLACAAGLYIFLAPAGLAQQQPMDHSQHGEAPTEHSKMDHSKPYQDQMPGMGHDAEKKKPAKKKAKPKQSSMPGMDHGGMPATDPLAHGGMQMKAFLGPYASTREGSGTSWLPDTTPHEGWHGKAGDWMTMIHGQVNLVYDHQAGPRGGNKTFAPGMLMGMAQKETSDGAIGLRAMISPDPFMGASGYPLLFATGESANGRDHLIDRQHPHDLFMELAATYRKDLSANSSVFIYGGLPGEPALGPPAFMHRTSGMDIPEAPITHHWLDSTHITFGVVTAGLVIDNWKLEGSAFRGREPDQYRYDIEAPKLDSGAARLSWNPTKEWSVQVSYGRMKGPEQLDPQKNEDRLTASAIYTTRVLGNSVWSTTFAWGHKMMSPGAQLNGYLLESALLLTNGVTLFGRAERVQENELLEEGAAASIGLAASPIFTVSKVTGGGIYDFYRTEHSKFGVGALVSAYDIPGQLRAFYGDPTSAMVFARFKVM